MSAAEPLPTPPAALTAVEHDHDEASHRRDTLLIIWLFASIGCFVVYAVYSSRRVTTRADHPPQLRQVAPPQPKATAALPVLSDEASKTPHDLEAFKANVQLTEERLRDLRAAKVAKQRQPKVVRTGETRRMKRIAELRTHLSTVTEYPEGSLQHAMRSELERLERDEIR